MIPTADTHELLNDSIDVSVMQPSTTLSLRPCRLEHSSRKETACDIETVKIMPASMYGNMYRNEDIENGNIDLGEDEVRSKNDMATVGLPYLRGL